MGRLAAGRRRRIMVLGRENAAERGPDKQRGSHAHAEQERIARLVPCFERVRIGGTARNRSGRRTSTRSMRSRNSSNTGTARSTLRHRIDVPNLRRGYHGCGARAGYECIVYWIDCNGHCGSPFVSRHTLHSAPTRSNVLTFICSNTLTCSIYSTTADSCPPKPHNHRT